VNPLISFHRLAVHEFLSARRWYARRSASAEAGFVAAVETALASIRANPAIGSPTHAGCRWVKVRRYSYVIYYRLMELAELRVFAVSHSSRRPGYWRRRLP
jgi:plasmid stabilization system protein ParE